MPTDRWTRFLLAPALVFIAAAVDRNYQTDLWHHLARGRAIVAEGRLLDRDRFTFTVPGRPLQDANWGWQVLFYRLYPLGGLPLVQTANAVILAVMMALLVRIAWRRSGSLTAACAVGVFAFLGLWQLLIIRPQTLSLLLFVILYGVLEEAPQRRWLLLLPPLLMALWANVHGGFPVGLALIGCYAVAEVMESFRRERTARPGLWLLCLAASIAATLANPYGWRVYEYVARTSQTAPARRLDEWLPPSLDLLTGKVWVLSLLLLPILFGLSRKRPRRVEWLLIGCFLPPACGSVRMVAWWLLVAAPVLAARLTEAWPGCKRFDAADDRPSAGNVLACGTLVAAMVLSLPGLEALNPVLSRPGRAHRTEEDLQAAAERLEAETGGGRVFTRFDWGEYVGWSLAPRSTVFMDGRIEIFPDEVWLHYSAVTRGRADWQETLDRYGADCLLLDAGGYHHDLLPLVENSPLWRLVGRHGDAVLFVRRQAATTDSRQAAR